MILESFSAHPVRTAVGAAAVAGLALWSSRAALDVAGSAAAPSRVAVLPSWPELAGLVVLMLIAAGATALARQRAGRTDRGDPTLAWDPALSDALRPLCTLAILALPYLPWVPDWIPALRLLAGPGRWLIWTVVVGQVLWILLQLAWKSGTDSRTGGGRLPSSHEASAFAEASADRPSLGGGGQPALSGEPQRGSRAGVGDPAGGHHRSVRTARAASIAVFVGSLAVYASVSARVTKTGFFPGGDEPHYLVMTQSLLRDHDLKIENNHTRGDYGEYFPSPLKPDYRARGADGEIYSIHPVGLPILVAPAFAVAGYRGVVWLLMLLAAGTATLFWRWTVALTGSAGVATFAWAAVALSAPYVFNSFTVYPEIPAAFCVMLAASVLRPAALVSHDVARAVPRLWPAALAVAALPWLSTKYAGMAVVLAGVLAWRHRRPTHAAVVLGPLAVSLAGWFSFFYLVWGSPRPSAPYGPDSQTSLFTFASGGPGLLFDQEYGVCAYAPVLVLGLVGLAGMWRERSMRLLAVEISLIGFALLALVGSFALWWGGSAMPGRPIIAVLPLLSAPIAWQYRHVAGHPLRSAAAQLLLLISLVITLTMTVVHSGVLAAQGRDGSSSLLEWLSPTWHLWAGAPTYIRSSPPAASAQALVWLGGAALVAGLCRRSAPATAPGRAARRVTFHAAIVTTIVVSAATKMPGARNQPRFDPEARAFFPMLETFDAVARPVGVRYDPFSLVAPSVIPPLFSVTAVPGQRHARQPLRVLLNARFRLPAGEYEVEIDGSDGQDEVSQGTIGLQIGREGNPIQRWPFTISRGKPWRQQFRLPLDAEFVALRAAPDIERAIAALELRPLRIVDANRRLRTDPVISSASFGSASIFFHDATVYAEPDGFWVRGQATLRATIAKIGEPADSIALNLHSGARPNRVTLATSQWSQQVDLVPEVTRTVLVPSDRREAVVPLSITTSTGFIPAEIQPGHGDRRLLGCWVAFAQ